MAKTLANVIDYIRNLYDQITADAESFGKSIATKRRESHINGRLKELDINYTDAKLAHIRVINAKDENGLKEKYFEDEIFIKLKAAFLEYHGELNEALLEETKGANTSVAQEKSIDIKLRRIEIPPFSGGYDQWRPFYELYVALVHSNESLADIQKLHYLKASVQGEAARLLQHVSLEEKNYASAWSILTERYENKRVLVNTHLRILLTQKTLVTETAAGIKDILDTTTECLHSLRNLGVTVDSWDMILIYILCAKLPSYTQELWEEQLQGAKNLIEFITFSKFLETRFRTLEAVEQSKLESRRTHKPSSPLNNQATFKPTKTFHTGVSNIHKSNKNQAGSTCRLCNKIHSLRQCEQFYKMDPKTRNETARKLKVCINCLSYNHTNHQCTSRFRCQECNLKHHTLLHSTPVQFTQTQQSGQTKATSFTNHRPFNTNHMQLSQQQQNYRDNHQQNLNQITQVNTQRIQTNMTPYATSSNQTFNPTDNNNQTVQTLFTQHIYPTRVLLATALVKCQAFNGENITFRALIDPGSEATFITETAVQKLRLPKRKTATNIISLGQLTTGTSHSMVSLTISSTYNFNFKLALEAFVYTNITSLLPSETVETAKWKHLENLKLADPIYNAPGKIDILLGADAYSAIILSGLKKGPPGTPIAQDTELGWIISGHTANTINKTIHTHHQLINLDAQLRRFWEIEEIPEKRKWTEEEKMCENHFVKTHTRLQDGKYQVSLPFKDDKRPIFEDSKPSAMSRLFYLEKRFRVNPKLRDMYKECLNDYISSSHMTEIQSPNSGNSYYLPHHAVFKQSSSTKLRVVFDASCKTKDGQSLNDTLMIGPTLQNELSSIINKWRKFRFAFTADITKMYRQIWIDPRDSKYQLICWRDNSNNEIKTYALKTVTFGTASAPFLAVRTLQQLAVDEGKRFPLAANILKNNFYVDDVMYGADSIEEALESQRQLIGITNSAGFPLRKWASNEETILKMVSKEDREIKIPLTFGSEDYVKTLGFQWYPSPDIFKFNFKLPQVTKISKREILADISRLFDPHGWISPCIVYAKLIMQELWLQHADWDDPVPDILKQQWLKYREELHTLGSIEIPRWIRTTSDSSDIELHGFCDASEKAYAAVVYIRIKHKEAIHVQLLTAKTKIAPIKRVSLPRLELCAAVLLARLLESIQQSMDFQNIKTFAWSDSMITLAWIKANPSRWKSFIANRVSEIQLRTSTSIWNHVNTKENPADIASRGLFPSEMANALMWWHGPPMLKGLYVKKDNNAMQFSTDLEVRKVKVLTVETSKPVIQNIIEKSSTLRKAVRVITYCLRAIYNFKHAKEKISSPLSVEELEQGLLLAIKITQKATFNEEIESIKKNNRISNRSSIIKLHPFLDTNGVLRVGGRLQNAHLPFDRQHPTIIPRRSHLTDLLIHEAHVKTMHGGLTLTTEHIQNKYWIMSAKNNIKKVINRCVICFKFKASETKQLMGNLPAPRVQITRSFYNTGVDYAGPIEMKAWKGRCNKLSKGYIAIFICLCTKAVHIEVVSDLSTSAFMAAYHRFTARRGICKNLYSDCGTNFVGAKNRMNAEAKIIQKQWDTDIANTLNTLGTQWHFNPPASPHFGGLWEAGVKSIKFHLKRVTGNAKLTFEEYATLLTQIEACLNSRPLCPKSQDPDDLSTLTPGHFLIMSSLHTPPEKNVIDHKISTLDRWTYIQQLYQTFWDKWSTEYLSRLQQRPKWNVQQTNVQIGNLVIIKDGRMPPTHWQLARVTATHPGEDNLTRVVTLKTASNILQRPIHKICLLPIADNYDNKPEDMEKDISISNQ